MGLGFPAVPACVVSLISNSTPVPFAAAGTPTLTTVSNMADQLASSGVAQEWFTRAVTHKVCFYLGGGGLVVPILLVAVLVLCFGEREQRLRRILEMLPFSLLAALSFLVPYYLLGTFLGPEFASIVGAIAGCSSPSWPLAFTSWCPSTAGASEKRGLCPSSDLGVSPPLVNFLLAWTPLFGHRPAALCHPCGPLQAKGDF